MSRKLIALLVAGALVTGALQPAAATGMMQTKTPPAAAKNTPPLRPGGAAGIGEAQGTADVDVWFISGLIVAAILAALLLADDDCTDRNARAGDCQVSRHSCC